MKLHEYHAQRQSLAEQAPVYRASCSACLQSQFNCYCPHIVAFDPQIEFVILIHPIEVRRRIATGRMSHLCLQHSHLILGQDYSDNAQVNQLLNDPAKQAVMLYPGQNSTNLSALSLAERSAPFALDKKLVIFVIDGTWATARNMVRQSRNLQDLPRVCFSLDRPSSFRVRKQPAPGCYSTIEAIHEVIELVAPIYGFAGRAHDNLLHVFDHMVERQLQFVPRIREEFRRSSK
ncbi:MAG: tRNA-uridine aminocarboxypropyltransferase [Pseudomonadota bacterium]